MLDLNLARQLSRCIIQVPLTQVRTVMIKIVHTLIYEVE